MRYFPWFDYSTSQKLLKLTGNKELDLGDTIF